MREEEINRLSSSLREVILYIKSAPDEEQLDLVFEQNERFRNLDIRAARVINELMNCNLELDEKREALDMCKAIDDMRRHAREEGIEQGRLDAIMNLMSSMGWTADQAMDAVQVPEHKRFDYAEKLQ